MISVQTVVLTGILLSSVIITLFQLNYIAQRDYTSLIDLQLYNSTISLLEENFERAKYASLKNKTALRETIEGQREAVSLTSSPSRTAVIFTMDSLRGFKEAGSRGGPSGEILIRTCLTSALEALNVKVTTLSSDEDFNRHSLLGFDYVILDPWTWAGPGWVAKPNLALVPPSKVFILDFFGHPNRREMEGKFDLPFGNILTAYGSPWNNTALLYYSTIDSADENSLRNKSPKKRLRRKKENRGVIWGKDSKHFSGKLDLLRKIADEVPLIATTTKLFNHPNIRWLGHVSPKEWRTLLEESKFLLGLGDPLLGPSAMDAILSGCMFINPLYRVPKLDAYSSQHPYAMQLAPDRVCSADERDAKAMLSCVRTALRNDFDAFLPSALTKEAHVERVKAIFKL